MTFYANEVLEFPVQTSPISSETDQPYLVFSRYSHEVPTKPTKFYLL